MAAPGCRYTSVKCGGLYTGVSPHPDGTSGPTTEKPPNSGTAASRELGMGGAAVVGIGRTCWEMRVMVWMYNNGPSTDKTLAPAQPFGVPSGKRTLARMILKMTGGVGFYAPSCECP